MIILSVSMKISIFRDDENGKHAYNLLDISSLSITFLMNSPHGALDVVMGELMLYIEVLCFK